MSTPLIIVVTLIYMGVSVSELLASRYGTALMFFAYALANIGIIMGMVR